MPLGKSQVERLAELARLKLSSDEIAMLTRKLTVIVDYFEQIRDVDTTSVDLVASAFHTESSFRKDSMETSLPRNATLKNGSHSDGLYYLVPGVIG